jgi:hypothetical protein
MKRRIAMVAAAVLLIGGATIASTASARDSFSIAIGAPGFGLGYSNRGFGYAYVAPPVVYSPGYYGGPAYYPAPAYYGPPVVYGPSVAYYRPWYHHRYYAYRHW